MIARYRGQTVLHSRVRCVGAPWFSAIHSGSSENSGQGRDGKKVGLWLGILSSWLVGPGSYEGLGRVAEAERNLPDAIEWYERAEQGFQNTNLMAQTRCRNKIKHPRKTL